MQRQATYGRGADRPAARAEPERYEPNSQSPRGRSPPLVALSVAMPSPARQLNMRVPPSTLVRSGADAAPGLPWNDYGDMGMRF